MMKDTLFSSPGYYCFQYYVYKILNLQVSHKNILFFYYAPFSLHVSCVFPPVRVAGVYLNGAFIFGVMRILLIYTLLPLGSSYHYGVCQNKPSNYGAFVMLIMPDFFVIYISFYFIKRTHLPHPCHLWWHLSC